MNDLANLVTTGESGKTFTLMEFDESFTKHFTEKGDITEEGSVEVNAGKVAGRVHARSDLYVRLRLTPGDQRAEVGWVAEYSMDLDVELISNLGVTYKEELWVGPKTYYEFYVVVVPVSFSVQPKIDGEFNVKLSVGNENNGSKGALNLKAGAKGSGRVNAGSAHATPFHSYEPPGKLTPFLLNFIISIA